MKYNPITNQLFTDDGAFLKTLHCPLWVEWNNLLTVNAGFRVCNHCTKQVYDTAMLNDNELSMLLSENPNTCLKIDINQPNLTLTHETKPTDN